MSKPRKKKGNAQIRTARNNALELERRFNGICLVHISEKPPATAQLSPKKHDALSSVKVRWAVVIFIACEHNGERYFRTAEVKNKIPYSMRELDELHSAEKAELLASINKQHLVSTGFIATMGKSAKALTDVEIDKLLEAHTAWDIETEQTK